MPSGSTANTSTSTISSAFIDDGFTINGVIEERRNVFPEVTLTYRPFTWSDRDKARRAMEQFKDGSEDQYEYRAKRLLERIERWNLGRPMTVENMRKLHPMLFDIMEALVFGITGPDHILTKNENAAKDQVANELKN